MHNQSSKNEPRYESDLWYVYQMEFELGPVSLEQLERYAASGRIESSVYVRRQGWSDWLPLDEVLHGSLAEAS